VGGVTSAESASTTPERRHSSVVLAAAQLEGVVPQRISGLGDLAAGRQGLDLTCGGAAA
jgi:hypothetical protein